VALFFLKSKVSSLESKPSVWYFPFNQYAGGRVEYLLKSGSISLDCRYEIGVIDLQKKQAMKPAIQTVHW